MAKVAEVNDTFISVGIKEVQRAYLGGAEDVNNSFARVAGVALQKGDGEAMAQFNRNKNAIDKAKQKL